MNNYEEWIAGTDPTNASSLLKMFASTGTVQNLTVRWQSVTDRGYFIGRSTDLSARPAFSAVVNNTAGQAGSTAFRDTNNEGLGPFFYRVRVLGGP